MNCLAPIKERETGLEPATNSLEGCDSSQLSYSRLCRRMEFMDNRLFAQAKYFHPEPGQISGIVVPRISLQKIRLLIIHHRQLAPVKFPTENIIKGVLREGNKLNHMFCPGNFD